MDPATREALVCAIDDAKARGWLQPDLRRYFKQRDIDFSVYAAAKRGEAVDCEAASVFAQISITGLPVLPYAPNPDDIRSHIDWLTEPARGQFDDALFEIAYDGEGRGPSMARLFALDEIDVAVAFAAAKNIEGRNLYIGAALRAPDTDRSKRSTGDDFYVATAVPIDIDHEYDATRARMASICDDGLVVTTGLTPERRSQHWTRLNEPCDDDLAFEHAFGALVAHTGADMKVKDKARIMRLGGTVSFPRDAKKLAAGYCTELTVVALNVAARTSDIDALQALEPGMGGGSHPGQNFDTSNRPQAGSGGGVGGAGRGGSMSGIERRGITGSGVVFNGREAHFRDLLLRHLSAYQRDAGADPSFEELWEAAWVDFSDPTRVDNADGRWTSAQGQVELRQRVQNTFRRLRSGRLARFGLYSIDTGAGQDEALAVQARRQSTSRTNGAAVSPGSEVRRDGIDLFEVLSIADLRALPDAEWTVKEVIPQSGLGFIYGPPGSYKTFVCCDLGLTLAYGFAAWLDKEIKHPGSVLYIANEGAAGLKNRITAWQVKNGVTDDTDRFRLIRKAMSFMDAGDVERLQRTVAAEVEARGPVDTVFVDTVSRVLPGADENLQKDMTIFVAACDRLREAFGSTVIGVHHTNKQGEMRGSTVFLGQGDFVFRVEKDDGRLSGVLTCEKQKEAEDGWKKTFSVSAQTWTPDGRIEPSTSLTVAFGGAPEPSNDGPQWPTQDVCKAVIWDLDNAWKRGKPWSPYPQTQKEGRYALRNISSDHKLPTSVVSMMLETWLKGDILTLEQVSSHSKTKGLKVLRWLD